LSGGKTVDYNDQVKNRTKRIEGQIRGILRMMEENKDCKDVITQLSAARTAIDRTIGVIVSSNLVECVRIANETGERDAEELVREAVNLLVKSR
jgi:DNA-binding FrmR family transcriptional regulator